jgi:hypothetical protein
VLILDIYEFMGRKGITANRFGLLSCGNNKLVKQLERGRTLTKWSEDRVRQFMAENEHGDLAPGNRTGANLVAEVPEKESPFDKMMREGSEKLLTRLWSKHPGIMRYRRENGARVVSPIIGVGL